VIAIGARADTRRRLEKVDELVAFARRRDNREFTGLVSDDESDGGGVEKFSARVNKRLQQIDDVVLRY
jgi:hypothetical protein